ncbi:AarF/ABC1/UbiB kinase family protein [Virgibacillus halophilus]|uniref:AarF/ABC1/UbiB kinase family protein n=2 Tax=Tigheibacillus halophilus TaxID=361280 RepID=A0ABU5C6T7_9BACI|nr:AarF/ABC1/UbiB kinase family protein [Virgibacillus halophilus]
MPAVFLRELTGLEDRVPADPYAHAEKLLREEWGSPPEEVMKQFDKQPVASASIGEVFFGVLPDGRKVAIKVQRYRIQDIFHKDFKALKLVFRILQTCTSIGRIVDLRALYREFVEVTNRELDFQKELGFANSFRLRYRDDQDIHIPVYMEDLCTKRVLVMEWIDGKKVTNRKFMEEHDIHPERMADKLFAIFLDQYLHEGYFHADPHAGNIMVQKDGRIVLLDFGMVGVIHKQDIRFFKYLIQGLIIDDYDVMIETLEEMGFILPGANKDKLKHMIRQTVEIYKNGSFQMNNDVIQLIMNDIKEFVHEQPIQLSAKYAFLGRSASIILGILLALQPDLNIGKLARPKVKRWIGKKGIIDFVSERINKTTIQPLIHFPKAMIAFLENGEKDRQWEKEKQQKQQMHHFYLTLELCCFILILTGTILWYLKPFPISKMAAYGWEGIWVVLFLLLLVRHFRMIRKK